MGRKNVLSSYPIFTAEPMDASFDNFSNPTHIEYLDNVMLLAEWTIGDTPNGILHVWVSNDKGDTNPQANNPPTNWYELDFGSPIVVNDTDNKAVINITQLPATWIAFSYERTNGEGFFTAKLTVKQVGG